MYITFDLPSLGREGSLVLNYTFDARVNRTIGIVRDVNDAFVLHQSHNEAYYLQEKKKERKNMHILALFRSGLLLCDGKNQFFQ